MTNPPLKFHRFGLAVCQQGDARDPEKKEIFIAVG
jgi:hypothetical protein